MAISERHLPSSLLQHGSDERIIVSLFLSSLVIGMKELSGQAVKDLLAQQIAAHSDGVLHTLAPFEPVSITRAWLDTIRGVEEFINIPQFGAIDASLKQRILTLRLSPLISALDRAVPVYHGLAKQLHPDLAKRFLKTLAFICGVRDGFQRYNHGGGPAALDTVEQAISYFQSRRRHMVAMFYTLPEACHGKAPLGEEYTTDLLTLIETSGITLMGLHQQTMLTEAYSDHKLLVDANGFTANHTFDALDALFLDPERASIVEMHDALLYEPKGLEPVNPRLIFSAAEFRNAIILIEAAYKEFDLAGSAFGPMAALVRTLLAHCRDDYLIDVDRHCFEAALSAILPSSNPIDYRSHLVHKGGTYIKNLDVFAPFIELGDRYVSTVTLLQRFLYFWKNVCLYKIRRFQIRAGFIFEDSVKRALEAQGFHITDVRRINSKEFDVVAVLDDTIYNIQCKNNLIDLSRVVTNPARYARYNRQLESYYIKALAKEEAREKLLLDYLGHSKIRHFVVSRFFVATANPRIVPFSRIDKFRSIVA